MRMLLLLSLLATVATPANGAPVPVLAISYHPQGKSLAVGTYGEVQLFDPLKGEPLTKLNGFKGRVTAVVFSPDGKRLAVASGEPGKSGEIQLFAIPEKGQPTKPSHTWIGHKDTIYTLTFSPDGKLLASAGYDRIIKFWNGFDAKPIRELKDHSDTVFGLAFHPEGKLLASASADRAVKLWNVETGARLFTLGESTDVVQCLAWNPNGKFLAAGGLDKSIRIWEILPEEGKLVSSVFAHSEAILKLIFTRDSKTIYSMSEGKSIKSWDATTLKEKLVFPASSDSLLQMALSPDEKQIAIGQFNGVLQILDAATGKLVNQPLPAKAKLNSISPNFGQRGTSVKIKVSGENLSRIQRFTTTANEIRFSIPPMERTESELSLLIVLPPKLKAGPIPLTPLTDSGTLPPINFIVDRFPVASEKPATDSARLGAKVQLPSTLVGTLERAGDADYYRFDLKENEELGVEALGGMLGSKLESVLEITDASGRTLSESSNGLLAFTAPKAGSYALGIRDKEFRGGADFFYRLHVGPIPIVTHLFPVGIQRGTTSDITIHGVFLPTRSGRATIPADAMLNSRVPFGPVLGIDREPALGEAFNLVGEFPELATGEKLPVPGTLNGTISKPGQEGFARFEAKKGETLIVEVNARRSGSPLDSLIEILDDQNQPIGRTTLRCVARVFSTFRDNDSAASGIRLESWNELQMNDYLYVGTELMRIHQLPKNPDDDCQFYSVNGQRLGFLDTTPTHHSLGSSMYKVEFHPHGSSFPPNGMPIFHLDYRNDDGGPDYGKDSRIFFTSPREGVYKVRIRDARNEGAANYFYRLTVRPPRPDFAVSFTPTAPKVFKNGGIPIIVTARRLDGFRGPIEVRFDNLPPGYEAPATTIEADQFTTTFSLFASESAAMPAQQTPLKLSAKALIDGKNVTHEATGTMPSPIDPGDIVTTTNVNTISVKPGQQTRLTVNVERRNGFKGRIPIEVRGLPYGTRVLNIGLNGILITERDSSREIVIYSEPWVQPSDHPIVILAKREGKNTEHAAKSVMLKVEK